MVVVLAVGDFMVMDPTVTTLVQSTKCCPEAGTAFRLNVDPALYQAEPGAGEVVPWPVPIAMVT